MLQQHFFIDADACYVHIKIQMHSRHVQHNNDVFVSHSFSETCIYMYVCCESI